MEENNQTSPRRKRRWWKWPAIAGGSLAALIIIALCLVAWILTPERLSRIIREQGTAYLVEGRVDLDRAELTVWSSFPHAEVTLDGLTVLNLRPEVPDTVLAVERLHGRVNLAALLIGSIDINHVGLTRPRVNMWVGADSLTSLSILPPSESKESEEPLSLPDIRLERFEILGDARLRYTSVPDSIDATVVIRQSQLTGSDAIPQYAFSIDGNLGALPFLQENLSYGIDGGIGWEPSRPLALSLHDFKVEIDELRTVTSLRADFTDYPRLEEFKFELKPLPLKRVAELTARLPQMGALVPAVTEAGRLELAAELRAPYTVGGIPDMEISARITDAPLKIPEYFIDFTNFGAELRLDLLPKGPDAAIAELKRLNISFPGSEFSLTARATNLLSDPLAKGCFRGSVNFNGLDPRIWTLIGMRLWGGLDADVDFNGHMSDLTVNTFHQLRLDGEASLRRFRALLPADTIAAGADHARLRFGSARSEMADGHRVDSLFTASVTVDSAWVMLPEMRAQLAGLQMGFGVENRAASLDTTTVTPMGAGVELRRLRFESADSTRAMLRGLSGSLLLRRYRGGAREPRIDARLGVERAVMAAGANRIALREASFSASAFHPENTRKRRAMTAAYSARMAARRDSMLLANAGTGRMDFGIDRSTVSLLRRWNISGSLNAKGGRLISPSWPLKTRMSNLDFVFSADSLSLRSLSLRTGRSDFSLTGSVSNIQRAMGRRHASQPLRIRLKLHSDSLNVNELVQTAFRGAAAEGASLPETALDVSDSELEASAQAESAEELKAIVVPMNIDAELDLSADNILYATVPLHDFRGRIMVREGAAILRDLHAATDIGSADLNMLYYAPTRADVDFGMGLELKRFNLGRVTEMLPALDSIMPMLRSFGGIVNAQVSATTRVDSMLNIDFPSLKAMVRLQGDSLVVLDPETFRSISKWLLFKNKNKNMIDHMDVHLAVEDNMLQLYPFMFDFDRYRIGVMGHNDMNLNLNYHISILKSPIPFRFGINVRGTMEKMKIRLGRARFKENMAAESVAIGDTIRLNLAREMRDVFRRGARAARLAPLSVPKAVELPRLDESADTLTAADSLFFRREGLIETPADTIR